MPLQELARKQPMTSGLSEAADAWTHTRRMSPVRMLESEDVSIIVQLPLSTYLVFASNQHILLSVRKPLDFSCIGAFAAT